MDRARFARDAFRPVAVRQESVNHVEIEAGRIGADEEFAATMLDDGFGIGSLSGLHLYILNEHCIEH